MHQILPFAVRPGSLWRGASAGFPLCLRASEGWSGGLGRSPPSLCSEPALSVAKGQALQGSGLMGVPLTQAVGLGFVISPLWG